MSDLIDRQAALDAIQTINPEGDSLINSVLGIIELKIFDLPSVQPDIARDIATIIENEKDMRVISQNAGQWIPCSERLPEDDTLMLVNYIDHRPEAMDIWIGWHEMENVWYINGEEHSRERGNEVIAWMPLPEPWRGGQDE